eukprot:CAMPEP_0173382826 /NCGR_PEP_ID=MMETSP1356-20130122/5355_1 /TAXON_ID=77927 ORGANISM="Hemiselmis virescens, Strain PCC157" /NCGR_SAMPLE_ID=MMETSP1356 /ASSEMBLY_ACC=CAM_ASM_000847 /LENGTH=81 /DNA_ID=CAMNT_0014337385 /DNA_START=42 /DNA_END=284 /DNA_ORIENTATION=-
MRPKDSLDEGHLIENALIKVPLDEAAKAIKQGGKHIEKELTGVQASLASLTSLSPARGGQAAALSELSRLTTRLQGLKRKL